MIEGTMLVAQWTPETVDLSSLKRKRQLDVMVSSSTVSVVIEKNPTPWDHMLLLTTANAVRQSCTLRVKEKSLRLTYDHPIPIPLLVEEIKQSFAKLPDPRIAAYGEEDMNFWLNNSTITFRFSVEESPQGETSRQRRLDLPDVIVEN